ncbi:hypothetical protein FRC07_001807, partial [Ceratobasidium sp. 392]
MAPLAPSKLKVSSKPKRSILKSKTSPSLIPKSVSNPRVSVSAKRKVVVLAAAPSESETEEEGEEEEAETHLQGFSSDEDSSDDDGGDDAPEIPGVDVSKLPTIAKDDATVKRKLERAKKDP